MHATTYACMHEGMCTTHDLHTHPHARHSHMFPHTRAHTLSLSSAPHLLVHASQRSYESDTHATSPVGYLSP